MDFDTYIQYIDQTIAELQDIRAQLVLAQGEIAAGKCPPVIIDPPSRGDCSFSITSWELDSLETEFRNWIGKFPDRLPDVQPGSGENG